MKRISVKLIFKLSIIFLLVVAFFLFLALKVDRKPTMAIFHTNPNVSIKELIRSKFIINFNEETTLSKTLDGVEFRYVIGNDYEKYMTADICWNCGIIHEYVVILLPNLDYKTFMDTLLTSHNMKTLAVERMWYGGIDYFVENKYGQIFYCMIGKNERGDAYIVYIGEKGLARNRSKLSFFWAKAKHYFFSRCWCFPPFLPLLVFSRCWC